MCVFSKELGWLMLGWRVIYVRAENELFIVKDLLVQHNQRKWMTDEKKKKGEKKTDGRFENNKNTPRLKRKMQDAEKDARC